MKKILIMCLISISFWTNAQDFTPKNWVTDLGDFYTDEEETELNKSISEYEKLTSMEIGIVTMKSLNGINIEEFTNKEFKRLGIGKKGANNGILVVFSMDDRKSRIEVGYGMEPFLTDLQTNKILKSDIRPNFKEGKYYKGTIDAVNSIKNTLGNNTFEQKQIWLTQKEEKERLDSEKTWSDFKESLFTIFMWLLIISFITTPSVILWHRVRKKKELIERNNELIKIISALRTHSVPKSTDIMSKKLKNSLNKLNEFSNEIIDSKDLSTLNEDLNKFKISLSKMISDWNNEERSLKNQIMYIKCSDDAIKDVELLISKAAASNREISKIYPNNSNILNTKIDNVIKLVKESKTLLDAKLIDESIDKWNLAEYELSVIRNSATNIINNLKKIEDAISNNNKSSSMITNATNNAMNYKKWSTKNELDIINSEINKYNNIKSSGTMKPLELNGLLSTLLLTISGLSRKWKTKKTNEEYSSSYSSSSYDSYSSSSSSSSSFDGFGGGSSGGGGSSSDW